MQEMTEIQLCKNESSFDLNMNSVKVFICEIDIRSFRSVFDLIINNQIKIRTYFSNVHFKINNLDKCFKNKQLLFDRRTY
jgi:hypothetical protein